MPLGFKTLGQVAWTPSLGVEALRKKVVRIRPSKKREGKEQECETENWYLLIFGVQSLKYLYLLLVLCPGYPESHHWISPFLEASWRWAPLNCDSDCSRSFPIIVHLPDWNRETDLFQHIYEWNSFFFNENRVCSLPNTVHHHPGQECPKCEWLLRGALLIPEPHQAFTLPVPGQSCHFLDHKPRSTASGRRHPRSRSVDILTVFS